MLIDLSGYSFSGKSALYDILSSVDNVGGFGVESEFELLRVPGGLHELVNATSGAAWSPIRSHAAIKSFGRLAYNLGGTRSSIRDRLFRLGTYYGDLFPGYEDYVNRLMNSFVQASWNAYWPFGLYLANPSKLAFHKVLAKLGFHPTALVHFSRLDREEANAICHDFFNSLVRAACNRLNVEHLLVNNAFEPSGGDLMYSLVPNCVPVVIDRDPRDIYFSAWLNSKGYNPAGSVALGRNIDDFIARFLTYREATSSNDGAVSIKFEEMVTDFDYFCDKLSFLKLNRTEISQAWSKHAPSSAKNIGLWKQASHVGLHREINYISQQLSSYCS